MMLKRRLFVVSVLALLLVSMFVGVWQIKPARATKVFASGFEEAQFNPSPGVWTDNGTSGTGSAATVQNTIKNSGSYAANFTAAAYGYSRARVYISDPGTVCHIRHYFYFDTMPTSLTKILYGADYSGHNIADIYANTTMVRLKSYQPSSIDHDYATSFSSATWYYVELKFVVDSYVGEYRVYIGSGTEVITVTGLNTTAAGNLRYVWVGALSAGSQAVKEYVDDVVCDTSFIGPLTPPSSTVLSVSLVSPATSSTLQNGTLAFIYTPLTYGTDIQNASLWTNVTGSWASTQDNTTVITNNTQNTISYSAWPSYSTYVWNIEVWNTTTQVFAVANYTFTLSGGSGLPYNYTWTAMSQMRAVFYSVQDGKPTSWDLIASTLAGYGVNLFDLEVMNDHYARFTNSYVAYSDWNISGAISAFHNYNISIYAHVDTMLGCNSSSMNCYFYNTTSSSVMLYGYNWLDIANPAVEAYMKPLIQYMLTTYAFDGFVFDYTRWDDDMPYGEAYDMPQFQADTGLDIGVSYATWLDDVLQTNHGGNGKYFPEFYEWRANLVTEWVGNITEWCREIRPCIKFGASTHGYGMAGLAPDYWKFYQGQDVNNWIRLGYLDWVAPMIYSNTTSDFTNCVLAFKGNATGMTHGLIPICPFITTGLGTWNRTTADIVRYVNAMNAAGGDGWIIWAYSGPGSPSGSAGTGFPDIRPYLDALGLPSPTTFSLTNLTVTLVGQNATVTWNTSQPVNSSIEYNIPPSLYAWSSVTSYQESWIPGMEDGFQYWRCSYYAGTVVSNSTLDISHTFTLTGLSNTTYCYQVRSVDASGTAFSTQLEFTAGRVAVTVTITSPTNTTCASSSVSVSLSASGGTVDTILWNCTFTNGTVAYANTVYTVATSMTLGNGTYIFNARANNTLGEWDEETVMFTVAIESAPPASVTLVITSPANTTYTSSTITISLSASGGTIDVIWWNIQFENASWLYVENQTYTVATSVTIDENVTATFHGYANNTDGNSDDGSVVFTVYIVPNTVGYQLGQAAIAAAGMLGIVMLLGMVYVALEGKDTKYAVMLAVGEVLLLVTMLMLSQLPILG
jgi:hypothetical protein